jgi:hypothetical protein
LLGKSNIDEVKNFTLSNFYMVGKSVGVVAWQSETISGIIMKDGLAESTNRYGGMVYDSPLIENCVNYSTFKGIKNISVFHAQWTPTNSVIRNCINYGNVSGNMYVAGISCAVEGNLRIENCKNYGDIIAETDQCAGIASANLGGERYIKKCENYGYIKGRNYPAGILSYSTGNSTIIGCKDYSKGKHGTAYGHIFGGTNYSTGDIIKKHTIIIEDCEVYFVAESSGSIFGTCKRPQINIIINNLKIINQSKARKELRLLYYIENLDSLTLKNIYIDGGETISSLKIYGNNKTDKEVVQVKNIIVEKVASIQDFKNQLKSLTIDGVIYFSMTGKKYYYGTDFSGFSYNNKKGKVELISFGATSAFQTQVNEQWLINKNYQMIAI